MKSLNANFRVACFCTIPFFVILFVLSIPQPASTQSHCCEYEPVAQGGWSDWEVDDCPSGTGTAKLRWRIVNTVAMDCQEKLCTNIQFMCVPWDGADPVYIQRPGCGVRWPISVTWLEYETFSPQPTCFNNCQINNQAWVEVENDECPCS